MPTVPGDNSGEIERLEEILNSGVTEQSTDGQRTVFDPEAIRKRIAELKASDLHNGYPKRRRFSSIDLGGF